MDDRARTNETHITTQDIEDLRKFIQAGLPQERSKTRNSRIICELSRFDPFAHSIRKLRKVCLKNLITVLVHGPKFQTAKLFSTVAHSLVTVDNWPWACEIHKESDKDYQRQQQKYDH
jgi:hypothetical protein